MTIERPDWNYDASGGLPAPANPPSPDTVIAMVEKGQAPTPEIQAALGVEPTALTTTTPSTPVPAKRGIDGIMREDWSQPRNEQGRYVSKTEGEMRAVWYAEGGLAHVAQVVTHKEAAMLSVAPSLQEKIATLDKSFLTKAADHLRLGVSYGPDGFWDSVARFEDSLSPSERDAWAKFCRSLDADEQGALIWGMSK
jgi:hypothetical protein